MMKAMQEMADEVAAEGEKHTLFRAEALTQSEQPDMWRVQRRFWLNLSTRGLISIMSSPRSGSAGTHAELVVGFMATIQTFRSMGINISRKKEPQEN